MKKAILGKKLGMGQIFSEAGHVIPVTAIEAGPCTVVQKKTVEHDGYEAIKVGFGSIREKLVNKPDKGQFAKAGVEVKRYMREFRLENCADFAVKDEIKADIFAVGDKVDVTGTSKGKGFQGVVARWNLHRGRMTHGSHFHRAPGAMAAGTWPGRVFKTKKLPGHTGVEKVTVQNLEVVRVDVERNLLLVKGAVPGPVGGLVILRETTRR